MAAENDIVSILQVASSLRASSEKCGKVITLVGSIRMAIEMLDLTVVIKNK